jgi:ubiquinone/menaquinone biosynthesis C-methylase UbiE
MKNADMKKRYHSEEIRRANIEYHEKMADSYDEEQPHYRPENVKRVERVIKSLAEKCNHGSLLDVGCGTGFIINIARKHFDRVVGIDITQAMLDHVDLSHGNIELKLVDSSDMPFEDGTFDVCTAYSFLHHLPTLKPSLKEIFRCLKKGGLFYADLEPNYYFWRAADKLEIGEYSPILQREVASIKCVSDEFTIKYDMSEETVKLAEFQRFFRRGLKKESVINYLTKVGFSEVDFEYQWFLGQGHVIHSISEEAAEHINSHLKTLLPLSKDLFKYFSFIAKK